MANWLKAITWARVMKCDIINMSFGIVHSPETAESIDKINEAIREADAARILLFAAASNSGGNAHRTYPASSPSVICVHAVDGKGNDCGGFNPPVTCWPDRIATLGLGVKCSWNNKIVYKSGTSFAAPLAAGIAANVLDYARHSVEKGHLEHHKLKFLTENGGMRRFFAKLLSVQMGELQYVAPWHLWSEGRSDEYVRQRITHDFNR